MLFDLYKGGCNYWSIMRQNASVKYPVIRSCPNQIYVDLTTRCNLRCRYCDIWKNPPVEEPSAEVWLSTFEALLDRIKYPKINLSGGEPMLHPAFFEILELACRKHAYIGFVSNGTMLTWKNIERLAALKLSNINISLDSTDSEIFDGIRGKKGHTAELLDNIVCLKRALEAGHSQTKIYIKAVIHAQNCVCDSSGSLCALVDWSRTQGVDGIAFQPICANIGSESQNSWHEQNPLWPQEKDLEAVQMELQRLLQMKQLAPEFIQNTETQIVQWQNYFRFPGKIYEYPEHDSKPCRIGFSHLFLFANGEVKLCPDHPAVGNIKTDPILKILNSKLKSQKQRDMLHCHHTACVKTCMVQNSSLELIKRFWRLIH